MRPGSLETLKMKIQRIKLGLLKVSGSHTLSIPTSCLIEVLRFSDDDHLWCTTAELSSAEIIKIHNSKVKLKFVQKNEGLFIKLTGHAAIMSSFKTGDLVNNRAGESHKPIMLKIKIEHADCFQKRSTSRYTSFLQSISHFATSRALASRGV